MPRFTRFAAALAGLIALAGIPGGCAATDRASGGPPDPVASLDWLAGHWRATSGDLVFEEYWMAPAGGTMLGVNRTIDDGRAVAFEFLRIRADDEEIVYLASPGGRSPPTAFRRMDGGPRHIVFENPDHDYPQRVIYAREGDVLRARIEGDVNGETRSAEWVYRRGGG